MRYSLISMGSGRSPYIFFFHLPREKMITEMIIPMTQENIREPNRAMG